MPTAPKTSACVCARASSSLTGAFGRLGGGGAGGGGVRFSPYGAMAAGYGYGVANPYGAYAAPGGDQAYAACKRCALLLLVVTAA